MSIGPSTGDVRCSRSRIQPVLHLTQTCGSTTLSASNLHVVPLLLRHGPDAKLLAHPSRDDALHAKASDVVAEQATTGRSARFAVLGTGGQRQMEGARPPPVNWVWLTGLSVIRARSGRPGCALIPPMPMTWRRNLFCRRSQGWSDCVTGAAQTSAVGVNDSGQIVGDYVSKAGVTNGYTEIDGKFTTIDDPSAGPSFNYLGAAYGINDAGTIVGSYINSSDHYEGFIDSAGAFTNISYPGAEATLAEDINDAGTVVGWFYDTNGGPHGFILSSGTYTEVNHPGAGTSSGQGTGLNGIADNGAITGWYLTSHNVEHGFLYKSGSFTAVNMPGAANSAATCISRSGGLIVGVFWNAGSQISGFELDHGAYTSLHDPAAGKGSTEPQDINNTGTVVGIYSPPPGRGTFAFIFTPPTSHP
jgi:probable HAF family extracellular repeat protein